MKNSERTLRMIRTLAQVAEAVHAPDRPNGTTVKLQRDLERHLETALGAVLADANRPDVPNGTTLKVLNILENG